MMISFNIRLLVMWLSMQLLVDLMQDDIEKLVSKLEDKVRSLDEGSCMDAIILPLHGSLPPELQVGPSFLALYMTSLVTLCIELYAFISGI